MLTPEREYILSGCSRFDDPHRTRDILHQQEVITAKGSHGCWALKHGRVGDFGIKHGADLLIEFLGRLCPRFLPVVSQYRRQNILKWGCM